MWPEWHGILFGIFFDSSLRVSFVATMVALILIAVRVRSSGVRHAAWTAVLCAMLLMPVLPYCVPSIAIPVQVPLGESQWVATMPEPTAQPDVVLRTEPVSLTPAPVTTRTEIVNAPAAGASIWPIAVLIIYGIGVSTLLFRLLLGWRSTERIARAGRRIVLEHATDTVIPPDAAPVYESDLVVAPLTVGVLSPRIILPATWRLWPAEKLSSVLAHEFAHVQRRDPIIGLLAHLNRCVFWFHPLSWWLERTLATTAEHACDDAAVRAIGKARRYAEVLLDMAEAVRRRGSRLSWQGVGVYGTGLLERRIDRILRGDLSREMSQTRKAIVAFGCAAAIVIVVACRQQPQAVAPLQEDPKVTANMAMQKADGEFWKAAREMNAQQVADLEASLKKNPENLVARKKLLIFYEPVGALVKGEKGKWAPICAQVLGEKECIAARRSHILWLIEHHADDRLAGDWTARIYPTPVYPLPDPAGYAAAKKLWLEKTSKADVGIAVLRNASYFFEEADKPLTEKMLLRAQALDPQKQWSYSLGRLYAFILLGSNSSTPPNVVRTVSPPEDAHSAYAQEIRKKLANSTDAELLTAAGQHLMFYAAHPGGREFDFDPRALGKSYLERALQLNPQSVQAREPLVGSRAGERSQRMYKILQNAPKESQYQTISALPEAERFEFLPGLAEGAYFEGEDADYKKDQAAAKASWDRTKKYAQDALTLAKKFPNDPNCGMAVYRGNMVLGTLAMWEGDKKNAVRYLLYASKAPASEELAYTTHPASERLVKYLLKYGERESVIEFWERMAQINLIEKNYILESAAAVRRGQMPEAYQATMTRQADSGTGGR